MIVIRERSRPITIGFAVIRSRFRTIKPGVDEMAEDRISVDTGTSELLCEIRDRVALITLNRPEARNALSDRLTPALRSCEPGNAP